MSADFALRLTDLRREKNLSQKEAASCLGVSQALLSHYEKGIRECKLDFIKKACDYYDVTSDYLLGLSDNRHGLNEIYTEEELSSDTEMKFKTIFRALVTLTEHLSAAGDLTEVRLREEMMLCVYRFALLGVRYGVLDKDWFQFDTKDGEILVARILDRMFAGTKQKDKNGQCAYEERPECLKTVITNSEEIIRDRYYKMLSLDKE